MIKYCVFTLLLAVSLISAPVIEEPKKEKHRIIIMTDMTHDDGNSLIRYLYYANDFDLEALIVTPQLPDFNHDDLQPWNKAQTILRGYKTILPNLKKHSRDFPSYESLVSITKKGRGALPIIWLTNEKKFSGDIAGRQVESSWEDIKFDDWIGEGKNPNGDSKDSDGSEFLIKVFNKKDDRPIYVQMWGGPITFIQALYRYRQRYGEARLKKVLGKIHVFGILLQDITFDYLINLDSAKALGCGNFGTITSTFKGDRVKPGWLLFDGGHFWRYITVMKPEEVNTNDVMSSSYDHGGEGDTPSFLYLLSASLGLNDPLEPTQGSWGTRFIRMPNSFPENYYSTCGVQRTELERWIPEAKNSFLARLKWSTHGPQHVNHSPVPILNGDGSAKVVYHKVMPGEMVKLDASQSRDHDNDALTFKWFWYKEASSYERDVQLDDPEKPVITFKIPSDIGENEIHLVLEVKDSGAPPLVAYRRVVFSGGQ